MLKLSLAAALAFTAAGTAFAEAPQTASLDSPVSGPKEFIAGATLWACVDKTCVVKTASSDTPSYLECRKLVQAVGKVTAYVGLKDDKLAMCNGDKK